MQPLLSAGDPPPFTTVNPSGRFPLLLLCDHAGKAVPAVLEGLGIPEAELLRHIGWDIGALDVAIELSRVARCAAGCLDVFAPGDRLQSLAGR